MQVGTALWTAAPLNVIRWVIALDMVRVMVPILVHVMQDGTVTRTAARMNVIV